MTLAEPETLSLASSLLSTEMREHYKQNRDRQVAHHTTTRGRDGRHGRMEGLALPYLFRRVLVRLFGVELGWKRRRQLKRKVARFSHTLRVFQSLRSTESAELGRALGEALGARADRAGAAETAAPADATAERRAPPTGPTRGRTSGPNSRKHVGGRFNAAQNTRGAGADVADPKRSGAKCFILKSITLKKSCHSRALDGSRRSVTSVPTF